MKKRCANSYCAAKGMKISTVENNCLLCGKGLESVKDDGDLLGDIFASNPCNAPPSGLGLWS